MLHSVKRLRNYALEHGSLGKTSIQEFADEIEYEVSNWYMPLPVGADSEPICVGEVVLDYDTRRSVVAVTPDAIVMDGYEDGDSIRMGYAANHSHVKPRTVRNILFDFMRDCETSELGNSELVEKYEAELRELLGGDAE